MEANECSEGCFLKVVYGAIPTDLKGNIIFSSLSFADRQPLSIDINCVPLNAHTCLVYAARIRRAVCPRTLCGFLFVESILMQLLFPSQTGTFFRNGPGKFTLGDRTIDHPYDGDGFVASIAFQNGRAFYRARFITTPEYKAEAAAEDVLFRGTFATQRSGGAMTNIGDLYIKNTSNTNVISFGKQDKLWTLFEAGQPYSLDPWTLSTIGPELEYFKPGLPFDLGSAENNLKIADVIGMAQQRAGPLGIAAAAALSVEATGAGGDAVTAHPHICPTTGRLVTFSYRVRPTVPASLGGAPLATDFTFFELDEETMQPVVKSEYSLPGFAFLHDFVFTENYYIIFQNPVTVDNVPYVLGIAPAASCVRWVPGEATRVHIIPRPKPPPPLQENQKTPATTTTQRKPPSEAMVFSAPPFFVFHHANAFESADGQRVTIDSIHYDSLPAVGREASAAQKLDPDAAFSSRLRRVEIDLATGVLRVSCVFQHYLEMPAINPRWFSRRHRFVYGYHSIFESPEIALAKVDVEGRQVDIWRPGKCKFALEPKFVPRKPSTGSIKEEDEDDGWILAQLFDSTAMQSTLVILDAKNLSAGPVAVVELKEPIPSALHSCWSDTCYHVEDNENGKDYGDGDKERRTDDENEQDRKWRGSGEQGGSMPSTSSTPRILYN